MNIHRWTAVGLGLVTACGGATELTTTRVTPGDPFAAHDDANVHLIGGSDDGEPLKNGGDASDNDSGESRLVTSPVLVGSPDGDPRASLVCTDDGLCEMPDSAGDFCEREGGPVDLIIVDGELVETVCYPPADRADRPLEVISSPAAGDTDIAQMANKTTVIFGRETDGVPIEGDLRVDGNNVAIYGNGPDETIIDGDVQLDGNNARLRGVTITGDLVLRKNKVAVVLCRVLGDVRLETMSTNGSVFAENEIFGSFTSTSNNNVIVGNRVSGAFEHQGNGNRCERNASFADSDDDETVDESEIEAPLDCPEK